MAATVDKKGRVTIPKRVRALAGLAPGTKLDLRIADGVVVLIRTGVGAPVGRFAQLRGHAGKGLSTDEIMTLTRGEV